FAAFEVVVGDLDRDGWLDVAVGGSVQVGAQYAVHLRTYRNTGPASGFVAFGPAVVTTLGPPQNGLPLLNLAIGDVDADGMLDLVVPDGRGTVWVLRAAGSHGVPSGTFQAPVGYPIGSASNVGVAICDIDQDGAQDLCMMAYAGSLRILEGQQGALGRPLGTFGPLHTIPVAGPGQKWSLTVRDFDRDGLPDIALGFWTEVQVLRGLGAFAFAAPAAFSLPIWTPEAPFGGDFDRDGKFDLAVPCLENALLGPNFRVLRDPLGAAQWSHHNLDTGYPERGVAVDYDRNGVLDVAVGKSTSRITTAPGQCTVQPAPGIAVVSPNGGEFLLAGSQTTIQWTASTTVAAFDVDVSFDDGATWAPVARQVVGTSCPWRVHEPSSNRARFRVLPVDLPVFADTSNGPVTIGGPGLASAVPLGSGCGQPFVPSANATVPKLGGTTRLELLGASPNVPAAWWLSVPIVPPQALAGGIGCFLWLDSAALSLLALASTDANGRFALDVPVPGNPALQGLVVAVQATAFVPASALGLQLSNGVGLVLGF
ncbi:MAG TPA: VCBS repeat-containing protein, partial [Planctomycetota bacterium]|nr:VCBS repeat-containing protein [Planctomycetota bacterium]